MYKPCSLKSHIVLPYCSQKCSPIFPPVSSRFPEPLSDLYDPAVIFGGRDQLAFALYAYETYTGEEWYEPWDAYNWVAGQL